MGVNFFYFIYIIYATTKNIATNQNQNKIRCYFKSMHIVINANQRNVILDKKKKKFGLILKYDFYTNNLLKNYIKNPTETFENQTCQYMI